MSPNTAKKKCKNFLSTLIRLADEQPAAVAKSVRNLIQGIIVSCSTFIPVYTAESNFLFHIFLLRNKLKFCHS